MCYEQLLTTIQHSWCLKSNFQSNGQGFGYQILALGSMLVVLYLRPMLTSRIKNSTIHPYLHPYKQLNMPILHFHLALVILTFPDSYVYPLNGIFDLKKSMNDLPFPIYTISYKHYIMFSGC